MEKEETLKRLKFVTIDFLSTIRHFSRSSSSSSPSSSLSKFFVLEQSAG